MMMAAAMTALTFYINAVALPAANQAHRQLVFSLIVSKARTDVRPRTFTEELLPGRMMLYVQDVEPETELWKNLLIHDLRDPRQPKLILARTGELIVDRSQSRVRLQLGPAASTRSRPPKPREYDRLDFAQMGFDLPVDEFFPDKKKLLLSKGDREMTLPELGQRIRALRAAGQGPAGLGPLRRRVAQEVRDPGAPAWSSACSGLALSLGSKKEARSAAFALSIARDLRLLRADPSRRAGRRHGHDEPWLSMWGANVALGAMALALLWLNHREAAFDPLDPSHYLAWLPRVRRAGAALASRPPRRAGARCRGAAGAAPDAALPVPARPLHRALLAARTSPWCCSPSRRSTSWATSWT